MPRSGCGISWALIRAKYPNANIKVLVGLQARSVLDGCPYINERIVCDFKGKDRGILGLWRLGKVLRQSCFDIVIDLQNNKKSHLLAALSFAPLRYGYDNKKWSFFLSDKIKAKENSAVIILAAKGEDKVSFIASITEDLAKRGLTAGELAKEFAALIGGSGGGKTLFAQGGGKDAGKLGSALTKIAEVIEKRLT